MKFLAAWLIGTLTLIGLTAPDAHADDTSYLTAVGGIYHVWAPEQMLTLGHSICNHLRERTADQQIALEPAQMSFVVDVPGVVYTAQRELCPGLGR